MRLLDLYCGAGGAGVGYARAGFDVVGVDLDPKPLRNYPFECYQGDALDVLRKNWRHFDAVHASPTCQSRSRVTQWRGDRANHPDTLTPTLAILADLPLPHVVENVTEAVADRSLRGDFILCGTQFGLPIRRHRAFQVNWPVTHTLPACNHQPHDLPFMHKGERAYADALGCQWMTNREGRQAVPPAYTEHIGGQLIEQMRAAA